MVTNGGFGEPRLFDGVTLRHFGIIDAMSLLAARVARRTEPRWTERVKSEVFAGYGQPDCDAVLAADFLGSPYEVSNDDLVEIFTLQIALREFGDDSDDPARDLGEAETLFVADKLNGEFITDDAAAYDFARRRLGSNRVFDTVDLLREAVVYGDMTSYEAKQTADAIRNSGRYLRRGHPATLTATYFAP
jgi:hypothetical protein